MRERGEEGGERGLAYVSHMQFDFGLGNTSVQKVFGVEFARRKAAIEG